MANGPTRDEFDQLARRVAELAARLDGGQIVTEAENIAIRDRLDHLDRELASGVERLATNIATVEARISLVRGEVRVMSEGVDGYTRQINQAIRAFTEQTAEQGLKIDDQDRKLDDQGRKLDDQSRKLDAVLAHLGIDLDGN